MASRRNLIVVSLVLVALAALLLWWQRRDRNEGSLGDDVAEQAEGQRKSAKPIGAQAEQVERHSQLPWNLPGTSVSGRVIDETGKPVAQADVCAVLISPKLPSALEREPKCTQSAADGRYTLAGLPPLRVAIAASAATFIPGHYDVPGDRDWVDLHGGRAAKDIDVVLRGGGVQVKGVVKDIAGGVIEGALVTASRGWRSSDGKGTSFGHSDAQGTFSMWVEAGSLAIAATADGYAEGEKHGVAPGYTFEVVLTPESVIAGRVVRASDGKPVVDALVMAGGDQSVYTDDGGNFRLDRMQPGRYKPYATHPESYGQVAESIRLGLGETVEGVVIQVFPMPAVRGTVMIAGDHQTPCEQGSVMLTGRTSARLARDEIAGAGEIEMLAVAPDTYDVEVRCRGYVAQPKYPEVVVGDGPVEPQTWEVKPGLTVKGVVVDQDGKPVTRATVGASPIGTAARAQQTSAWGAETDEKGAFELSGILPGSYELHADHDDLLAPETAPKVTISAGESPAAQRLVLELGGSVHGRVVDAERRPVANASVRVIGNDWGGASSNTADDGTFVIDVVRPGDVRVVAQRGRSTAMRAPGTSDDDVQGVRVQVSAGAVADVELIVEEQFGKISGKVVDADGGPVDDAFVQSTRESDSAASNEKRVRAEVHWGQWNTTPSLTEQDGSFTLGELEIGKHTLMAMRKGGGEGIVEHIETGATGVVIHLAEGGTLSGTVVLGSGGAPRRFSILAQDRAQGIRRSESFFETAGTWKLADLPAGKYIVGVTATEGSADIEVELAEGAEQTDVELRLLPKVDVSGTVVDLDTGEPVAGMAVNISSRRGGGNTVMLMGTSSADQRHVSDESGRFLVRAASAGAVRVSVSPRNSSGDDQGYQWSNISLQIPGDVTNYGLPPIRVAKSKLERGTRGGDFGITMKQGDPEADDEDVPLQIAVIRPGSAAAGSELKIGDVIVEVDGKDVTGANKYLFHALTQVKEGDAVSFSVKDGGSVTLVAGKPI